MVPQGAALARRVLENRFVIGYTLNMKLPVTFDRIENGVRAAECPAIPSGVRQGKTKPEAFS